MFGITSAITEFLTIRCRIKVIGRLVAGRAPREPEKVMASGPGVGLDSAKWNAGFTHFWRRKRDRIQNGLSLQTRKSVDLHHARGVQQIREPRHALEYREGFDGVAVAGAQGVLRPCAFSVGACGYELQNCVHDRVSRPAGARMEARPGGG